MSARLDWNDIAELLLRRLATLGEGSYGKVSLVHWGASKAVVKVSHSAHLLENFQCEADLLEKLGGAGGAPRLLGFCEAPPSILMSYCGRKTLKNVMQGGGENTRYDLLELGL